MIAVSKNTCQTCEELWRELARATAHHVKLLTDSQAAVLDKDAARQAEIEALVVSVDVRRSIARKAIRDHEATEHGGGASLHVCAPRKTPRLPQTSGTKDALRSLWSAPFLS